MAICVDVDVAETVAVGLVFGADSGFGIKVPLKYNITRTTAAIMTIRARVMDHPMQRSRDRFFACRSSQVSLHAVSITSKTAER